MDAWGVEWCRPRNRRTSADFGVLGGSFGGNLGKINVFWPPELSLERPAWLFGPTSSIMDHLRPSWDHLEPKTGPRYAEVRRGTPRYAEVRRGTRGVGGGVGAILGPLEATLGPFWALLGPSWGHLRVILGSSWGHLGVILGSS